MKYEEAKFELSSPPGAIIHLYLPARAKQVRETFQRICERPLRPPSAPDIIELEGAILSARYERDCLFDSDGKRIEASCVLQYDDDFTASRWRAVESIEGFKVDATIEEPVVYQSVYFGHWGHFLLESMARAWALQDRPELTDLPSAFARALQPEEIGANQREVLTLAGARRLLEARPRATLRLAKCYVPSASFTLNGEADPRHLEAPHRVAERLLKKVTKDSRPAYLSRTQVASNRPHIGPLRNEPEFEARLEALGVRIVHMQRHSLAEQIEIMNAHDVFIGPWGSALHNTLFCLRGREVTTFVIVGGFTPISFILVDSIVGNAAHYLMVLQQPPDFAETKQHMIDIDAAIGYLQRHGAI